jgi:hypothetical protein
MVDVTNIIADVIVKIGLKYYKYFASAYMDLNLLVACGCMCRDVHCAVTVE